MAKEIRHVNAGTKQDQLSEEWRKEALKVAKEYNLPLPTDQEIGTAEDAEQQLRWAEQDGGE